jgi:hypothetical protein
LLSTRVLLIALLGVLAAAPAAGAAPKHPKPRPSKQSLAVVAVTRGEGFSDRQVDTIEELLLAALDETGHFKVTGRSDIKALLTLESQKQAVGCEDDGCMAQIAGALGVDLAATANIGKLGSNIILTLKVIDVKSITVIVRAVETVRSDDALPDATTAIAGRIVCALWPKAGCEAQPAAAVAVAPPQEPQGPPPPPPGYSSAPFYTPAPPPPSRYELHPPVPAPPPGTARTFFAVGPAAYVGTTTLAGASLEFIYLFKLKNLGPFDGGVGFGAFLDAVGTSQTLAVSLALSISYEFGYSTWLQFGPRLGLGLLEINPNYTENGSTYASDYAVLAGVHAIAWIARYFGIYVEVDGYYAPGTTYFFPRAAVGLVF